MTPRTTKVCVRFHTKVSRDIAFSYRETNDPQSEAHLVSDVDIIMNESAKVPLETFLWSKEKHDFDVYDVGNISTLPESEAANIRAGAPGGHYSDYDNPYEGDTDTLHKMASALARTLKRV
jgi:hypothetical protein